MNISLRVLAHSTRINRATRLAHGESILVAANRPASFPFFSVLVPNARKEQSKVEDCTNIVVNGDQHLSAIIFRLPNNTMPRISNSEAATRFTTERKRRLCHFLALCLTITIDKTSGQSSESESLVPTLSPSPFDDSKDHPNDDSISLVRI